MVLILGCGYTGTYIARLLQKTYPLVVTTRSEERLTTLQQEFSATLLNSSDSSTLHQLLLNEETLIVTVAAKDSTQYKKTYLDTALNIKKALTGSTSLKHIIYTSSTSVYGDAKGKTVTEDSPTLAASEQGKILIETEQVFLSLKSKNTHVVIFRLPEIYGPDRTLLQKIRRLQGNKAPGDGTQLAHLIHVQDIAHASLFAIKHDLDGIYILCEDEIISRKELYDTICKEHDLPLVEWDPTLTSIHRSGSKRLSNQKIKDTGFRFHYSHLKSHS